MIRVHEISAGSYAGNSSFDASMEAAAELSDVVEGIGVDEQNILSDVQGVQCLLKIVLVVTGGVHDSAELGHSKIGCGR